MTDIFVPSSSHKFKPFGTAFHCHCCTGSLDSGSNVKDIVEECISQGYGAVSITDHGTLNALAELNTYAKKRGIKATNGIEAYVYGAPWEVPRLDKHGVLVKQYAHATIHFMTERAYLYFCKLSMKAANDYVQKFGEVKPLIQWSDLEEIASEIVLGSGCLGSWVQKAAREGGLEKAEIVYQALRNLVTPDRFYPEIMPHQLTSNWVPPLIHKESREITKPGYFKDNEIDACSGTPFDVQKDPNLAVLTLAKKYGDKFLVSLDAHIANKDAKLCQDVKMGGFGQRWRFSTEYSIMRPEEAFERLQVQLGHNFSKRDMEAAIEHSWDFLKHFEGYKFTTTSDGATFQLPDMLTIYGESEKDVPTQRKLVELIKKHGRMPEKDSPDFPKYAARLKHEVDVLTNNGIDLLPYFFFEEDVVSAQRALGNFCSPRGSAGASLLLYLLGISITDPMKYEGLMSFSRFINAGRIKGKDLPDVDNDFGSKNMAIEYARTKYGDKALMISTSTSLHLKSSIKDIERLVFGRVKSMTEQMCKMIENIPQGLSDKDWLYGWLDKDTGIQEEGFLQSDKPGAELLRSYIKQNSQIWKAVEKCLGVERNRSKHASGLVVASKPIYEFMPVLRVDDDVVTSFTMNEVALVGGVKFDFLGLNTLDSISLSFKYIQDNYGVKLEWKEFPEDEKVFEFLGKTGKTAGLYQVNGVAVRPLFMDAPPKTVLDWANIVSIGRPGCLDAASPVPGLNNAQFYIEIQKGQQEPIYIHPDLKPILSKTNSILIFQEQIMEIFKTLADFDDEQADKARKGVGKKDKDLVMKLVGQLKEGCIRKGWTEEQAQSLALTVAASARYSYNFAHALSVSVVGYIEAWLKYYYPLAFYAAKLTVYRENGHEGKLNEILAECRNLITSPSITHSDAKNWKIQGDKLIPPLNIIKGVGQAAAQSIREFTDSGVANLIKKPVKEKKAKTTKTKLAEPIVQDEEVEDDE